MTSGETPYDLIYLAYPQVFSLFNSVTCFLFPPQFHQHIHCTIKEVQFIFRFTCCVVSAKDVQWNTKALATVTCWGTWCHFLFLRKHSGSLQLLLAALKFVFRIRKFWAFTHAHPLHPSRSSHANHMTNHTNFSLSMVKVALK